MRFVAGLLSFSLIFFTGAPRPARAAAAPVLDALLAKARATSGSPYLYHIVSHSHESIAERTYAVTTESEGLKYRERRCLGSVCFGFYFDGERSFDTNFNDTALPRSNGNEATFELTLRAITSYAFAAPEFVQKGGRLSECEPVMRAGRLYRCLSVALHPGVALDALVDPENGIVAAIVSPERGITIALNDQRPVGGKLLLPYTIALNDAVIERFEDRVIDVAPLAAPLGIVPTFSGEASVPMRTLGRPSDQPVVPCTIGSQKIYCLLDSGNSGLSMSLELSEKLAIEPENGTFDVSGIGRYVTGIVKAPPLTVGPASYPSGQYVVLHDLHQYGYDVVLGADAFASARITIDYAGRTVTLAASEPGSDLREGDLSFENFVPIAPVRLGDLPVRLAIDTGDESAINLSYDYYAEHPSIFKPEGTNAVAGIGGTAEEVTGTLARAHIENFDIDDVTIGATKKLVATAKGHVGSGLLRRFVVTFDYAHARLELTPHRGDASVRAAPAP